MSQHLRGAFEAFETTGASQELVVLLHGWTHTRQDLASVHRAVRDAKPDADVLAPNMPLGRWSCADPEDVARDVSHAIEHAWKARRLQGTPYRAVTLVGHSCGALIARRAYASACKARASAPRDGEPSDAGQHAWADSVERLVLLAGMNNGWEIDHHLSKLRAIEWSVGIGLCYVAKRLFRRVPIILTIRRGSPFIARLREEWSRLVNRRASGAERSGGSAWPATFRPCRGCWRASPCS